MKTISIVMYQKLLYDSNTVLITVLDKLQIAVLNSYLHIQVII